MSVQGLPVAGYKVTQPQEFIDAVNHNKELEERVLRQIDQLFRYEAVNGATHDKRALALAKTSIQDGFMWLNRAIFQPGRIALPEDAE